MRVVTCADDKVTLIFDFYPLKNKNWISIEEGQFFKCTISPDDARNLLLTDAVDKIAMAVIATVPRFKQIFLEFILKFRYRLS